MKACHNDNIQETLSKILNEVYNIQAILEKNDADRAASTVLEQKEAVLYAYRYLLNREPEDMSIVENNTRTWKELRRDLMNSEEYCIRNEAAIVGEQENAYKDVFSAKISLEKELKRSNGKIDYESLLEKTYSKIIHSGNTVIDIGAHIGRHSEVFIQLVGENGTICCFEPLPKQYKILRKKFGALKNVELINCALSNQQGKTTFYVVENYPEESGLKKRHYNNLDAKVENIEVNLKMLDEYTEKFSRVDYIKLDAEGAEINILNGGKKLIEKHRPIISVEYGAPSYSVYGLTKKSLWDVAQECNYFLTDIFGNVMFTLDVWEELCDSIYWDYFLVPKEKIKEFMLNIHS